MKNRPFAPLVFLLLSVPLVLDGMPPLASVITSLERSVHGVLPLATLVVVLVSIVVVRRQMRREEAET